MCTVVRRIVQAGPQRPTAARTPSFSGRAIPSPAVHIKSDSGNMHKMEHGVAEIGSLTGCRRRGVPVVPGIAVICTMEHAPHIWLRIGCTVRTQTNYGGGWKQ